ncbi:MAG: ribonuclease [Betaproteobacteria bacterium]
MIDNLPAPNRPRSASVFLVALLLVATVGLATAAFARSAPPPVDVMLVDLPREAQDLFVLIGKGGPFRYSRDGVSFGNRERLLPLMPKGYYREYTVRTAGARDRGARRMVCGGPSKAPEACYYSDDHYQSFRRIRQ